MKKLVEEVIAMCTTEGKTWKFAKYPHVQIEEKTIHKPGDDNRVDHSSLIVKKTVQDQGIPQAQNAKKSSYRYVWENLGCASLYYSRTAPPAKA